MLTLYYKPTCPYSRRVLATADRLNLTFDLKDVGSDETLREELIAKGGKKQVPYLVDTERGVAMYESGDIIAHLEQYYGGAEAGKYAGLRIHRGDEVCE